MINCVAGEDNGAGHDNTINSYKEDKNYQHNKQMRNINIGS